MGAVPLDGQTMAAPAGRREGRTVAGRGPDVAARCGRDVRRNGARRKICAMHARSRVLRSAAIAAFIGLVAACGGAPAVDVMLSDAPVTPTPATPAATPASPGPTAGDGSTALPSAATGGVSARWAAPADGATIGRSQVTLSSKPVPDTDVARVVYRVTWDGGTKRACVAKVADDGKWACRADLLALGVPPGPVSFDFDVVLADGLVVGSPAGGRSVTYGVAPPKPANTSFKLVSSEPGDAPSTVEITRRAKWSSPEGYADEFLVYGMTTCLRESAKYDGKPCVVPGMKINMADLELLATATGDKRSMLVRWTVEGELGISPYRAFLLRGSNQYGNSAFAILHSEDVCWMCTY
jgi:hypothetical protein